MRIWHPERRIFPVISSVVSGNIKVHRSSNYEVVVKEYKNMCLNQRLDYSIDMERQELS